MDFKSGFVPFGNTFCRMNPGFGVNWGISRSFLSVIPAEAGIQGEIGFYGAVEVVIPAEAGIQVDVVKGIK